MLLKLKRINQPVNLNIYLSKKSVQEMSKQHKIFGPYNGRGVETVTGRNAYFSKKPDYADSGLTETSSISPFNGYSAASSRDLSQSLVSEASIQFTRKLIREELQSQKRDDAIRNQMAVLKTEMRSLKEFIENQQDNKDTQNLESFRTDIQEEVGRVLEEHRIQTVKNLREIVKKIDQNVKKDIMITIANQYLPISFLDEVDQQFNELEDRIMIAQDKLSDRRVKQTDDIVATTETFDLRLKKLERESGNLQTMINGAKATIDKANLKYETLQKQQQISNEKLNHFQENLEQLQQQLEKGSNQISEMLKDFQTDKKQNKNDDEAQAKTEWSGEKIKEFMSNSSNLVDSQILQTGNQIIKDTEEEPKPITEQEIKEVEQNKDQKQEQVFYMVDMENFLLDSEGNYITDNDGNSIQLSQSHLQILQHSDWIKMTAEE